MTDWLVLKFGGTSVATRERWNTIRDRANAALAEGLRPVIVCSAVTGVTNRLEALPKAARKGDSETLVAEIRAIHEKLAEALEIALPAQVVSLLDELRRLAEGITLVDEASARVRARILAMGELLSTLMGAEFLKAQGVSADWLDARGVLVAQEEPAELARQWLSASCAYDPDPALQARLAALPAQVFVTQGFIAGSASGQTVVLGRGGSDTSAAYLAAKLEAKRCEIWTDVPGMFTGDPRILPGARILRKLDYSEAQEIASTGAKVLHPRSVPPVRQHGIPMTIRCAPNPEMEWTTIEARPSGGAPQVKALSSKRNVTLVSMDDVGMWQEAGFLADIFAVFKRLGISVDLVSTSETNVTVTLDHTANALDEATLERLAADLEPLCRVNVVRDVAAISLVGIGIRGILHKLGAALEQFEEQPVHLVSQAASDLNLTFVVDADREERMLRRLHGELFQAAQPGDMFGPTWRELFEPEPKQKVARRERWWAVKRDALLALADEGTPAYVYDEATVQRSASELRGIGAADRVFYAMKANSHPDVLRIAAAAGLGFECVSPGEIRRARESVPGLGEGNLLFTPNFAPRADYVAGFDLGAHVTVDNLHPLEHWPEVFAGRDLLVRVDVGIAKGHHKHVKTAGAGSKFGLDPEELPTLRKLVERAGARVVGLHAHSGSGIKTPDNWREVATRLAEHAELIPGVRVLDVGGGLGVPERPGQTGLDLKAVDSALGAVKHAFGIDELWIEPGRYVVAEAGVLLARVTQIKRKRGVTWIGVDAGMNTLIRPALYGAWHEIVNLSRLGEKPSMDVQIVGPICESGDVLGRGRRLPPTREGDVLLIGTAGAYGRTMASEYNLRGMPREIVLRG